VLVGRLLGAFGVRGELKFRASAFGAAALAPGRSYALGDGDGARRVRCVTVRRHHDRLIVTLEGVGSPEAARELAGAELFAERDELVLEGDEYFDADLIGLQLLDESGKALGEVVGVEHYPAQDCLVVGPAHALVPLVKAFVRAIDLEARTIVTSLPEGLL
jgi:16S rRNA processing protein RimM